MTMSLGARARLAILAATIAVVAGFAGFMLSRTTTGPPVGPHVTSQLVGVVSKVNADKTNICVIATGSSDAVCSGLWIADNQAFPTVGARIAVWVVRVPVAQGEIDQFVLQPARPTAP